MLDRFPTNSTALVQGASRGIGLEFVRVLLDSSRFDRIIATCRNPEQADTLSALAGSKLEIIELDVEQPEQFANLAEALDRLDIQLNLVVNAAGVLHGKDFEPEKKLESLDSETLHRVFAVNAFAPALLLKAVRPFLTRRERCVFAAISARVGSIGDNRLGGWYAYRASKAALNQLIKTASIELARRNRNAIIAALHPGTTDTDLSRPFQDNVPDDKLFSTSKTVRLLLDVIDDLKNDDSGGFFAWDGQAIPW